MTDEAYYRSCIGKNADERRLHLRRGATPRGRGRPDGSLHEITALSLAGQSLRALKDRNDLDTSTVGDVVLGCLTPLGVK